MTVTQTGVYGTLFRPGPQLNRCGSPPRAWGHHRRQSVGSVGFGFTPTCVGTPPATECRECGVRVHPHVRGDTQVIIDMGTYRKGSPPRAWGHRWITTRSGCGTRFTPTCVGTPLFYALRLLAYRIALHPLAFKNPVRLRRTIGNSDNLLGFSRTCGVERWTLVHIQRLCRGRYQLQRRSENGQDESLPTARQKGRWRG